MDTDTNLTNFILPIPNQKGWTVYTKSNCKYCSQVKILLEDNDEKNFQSINSDEFVSTDDVKKSFLSQIEKLIGFEYKTFPMVFYDGIFVGGFTDTVKFIENKKFTIRDDF
jgi:glutaredoxin